MFRPLRLVLVVLVAFAVSAHVECRESEACKLPAVTHNEGFA
jgi:hypothetical protein